MASDAWSEGILTPSGLGRRGRDEDGMEEEGGELLSDQMQPCKRFESMEEEERHEEEGKKPEVLPGPSVGEGGRWDLAEACARTQALSDNHRERLVTHLNAMLQDASSDDSAADVVLLLDAGSFVRAHKVVLITLSSEWKSMFQLGTKESLEGVVHLPGVGKEALRAYLEWSYLGECRVCFVPKPKPSTTDWVFFFSHRLSQG